MKDDVKVRADAAEEALGYAQRSHDGSDATAAAIAGLAWSVLAVAAAIDGTAAKPEADLEPLRVGFIEVLKGYGLTAPASLVRIADDLVGVVVREESKR